MSTINTLLREARESKGITIKDAAKALKIRERHLEMLEQGQLKELEKEIYLSGVLRSYADWLNVDGGEILTQVNQQKQKISAKAHSTTSSGWASFGLIYIGYLARRPGIIIFLISLLFTIGIYTFWYNTHRPPQEVDILHSFTKSSPPIANSKYTNILQEYVDLDLVFLPRVNVEIKISNTETGEEKINKLTEGDVFFFHSDDKTLINTNTPKAIDVFIDNNNEQEPVGTLDNILMNLL